MSKYFYPIILLSRCCLAADWRPIDPAELAQKTPRVDPAADAEAIFWDVHIEDRIQGARMCRLR